MPNTPEQPVRHRARKRFGQHFLEPAWAQKVVAAIAPSPEDTILEIGPGQGAITAVLAERTRDLFAFEIDRDLAAALRASTIPRLQVVEGDFLDLTAGELRALLPPAMPAASLRVAGNLPYNVASPIMFALRAMRQAGIPLVDASLMLQREVAERLMARPGTHEYGVLSVLIQQQATVSRLLDVPPGAFRPMPKVQSTVVRLAFHAPHPAVTDQALFDEVVQAVFTRRRKTLANALLAHPRAAAAGPRPLLEAARLDAGRRPETLTLEEFGRLADTLATFRAAGASPPP